MDKLRHEYQKSQYKLHPRAESRPSGIEVNNQSDIIREEYFFKPITQGSIIIRAKEKKLVYD